MLRLLFFNVSDSMLALSLYLIVSNIFLTAFTFHMQYVLFPPTAKRNRLFSQKATLISFLCSHHLFIEKRAHAYGIYQRSTTT